MATYTTPLRAIIEQPTQHRNDLTLDQKIEVGRKALFDFDYPMFDNRYKKVFETNFINNFYDREIGFETEYLFKRRLQNWLRINMPYWSNMMESEQIKFDPLINSEMNTTHIKKNDEESQSDRNFGENTSSDTLDNTTRDLDTSDTTDKDVTGNTENTGTKDTDIDTTTDSESDLTGNVSGTSSGSSDTTDHSETDESVNTNTDTDRFNREISSDTPDSRLAITANDGVGLVDYATNIEENKGTESVNQTQDTNSTTDSTSSTDTEDQTNTDSTQNQIDSSVGTSNENTNTSDIGEYGEQTDVNEKGTEDETIDRTIGNTGTRDFDENIDGTKNTIEDFVQNRIGKIGVQTYSKMLMEYRQTFLRIEKDIFDEMNQLFMLVY